MVPKMSLLIVHIRKPTTSEFQCHQLNQSRLPSSLVVKPTDAVYLQEEDDIPQLTDIWHKTETVQIPHSVPSLQDTV